MGHCDICNDTGDFKIVSSKQFKNAVLNRFNPIKLDMITSMDYTAESWEWFALSPIALTSAWAICGKFMKKRSLCT